MKENNGKEGEVDEGKEVVGDVVESGKGNREEGGDGG